MRLLRQITVLFLRSTARGPLVEALPGDEPGRATRLLHSLLIPQMFRAVGRAAGRFLTARQKARIQDALINRFRVPVNLQRDEHRLRGVLRRALRRARRSANGDGVGHYLEFGVYQGNSLIQAHHAMVEEGLEEMRLFGFDSFAGLPATAEEEGVWSDGQYRVELGFTRQRLEDAGVDLDRTVLVPGFFSDTLGPEVVDEHAIDRASVIMIDCDLYSSAREALEFCEPLIRGEAVVLFDDWHSTAEGEGEQRAFQEFVDDNPHFEVEEFDAHAETAQGFLLRRLCTIPLLGAALDWTFGGLALLDGLPCC